MLISPRQFLFLRRLLRIRLQKCIYGPRPWRCKYWIQQSKPVYFSFRFCQFITSNCCLANFVWFVRAMKHPVGILHVKVLRALKLNKKDLMGASDPYVKFKLTEDKLPSKKTTVKYSNLNPEWNEEFNLVVKDPESQVLELNVYDWEQVSKFGVTLHSLSYSLTNCHTLHT